MSSRGRSTDLQVGGARAGDLGEGSRAPFVEGVATGEGLVCEGRGWQGVAWVALLKELEGSLVLCDSQPVGEAQGLHVGDPVDGKLQVAAGGLCQDDLVVDRHGSHSLLQQGDLLHRWRCVSIKTVSTRATRTAFSSLLN